MLKVWWAMFDMLLACYYIVSETWVDRPCSSRILLYQNSVNLWWRARILLYIAYFTACTHLGRDWLSTRPAVAGGTFMNEFKPYAMQAPPLKRRTRQRFTEFDYSVWLGVLFCFVIVYTCVFVNCFVIVYTCLFVFWETYTTISVCILPSLV